MLVVALHIFMVIIPEQSGFASFIPGAFVAMDVFFVLSAFLVTTSLLNVQMFGEGFGLKKFYFRRVRRLLPPLAAMLIVYVAYTAIVGFEIVGGKRLIATSIASVMLGVTNFRMTNILAREVADGLSYLWSIAVEMQFYLVWPIVVSFIISLRRSFRANMTVLFAALAFIVIRRYILYSNETLSWFQIYIRTDTRADSLLVGAIIAYAWVYGVRFPPVIVRALGWVGLIFYIGYIALAELDQGFGPKGGYTITAVMFGCILLATLELRWAFGRLMEARALRVVGRSSYSLYIWHFPIIAAVARHGHELALPVRLSITLMLIAIATMMSYLLIERRFTSSKMKAGRHEHELASDGHQVARAHS